MNYYEQKYKELLDVINTELYPTMTDLQKEKLWGVCSELRESDKYDGNMDKECIGLCDMLNSLPGVETFESCCGHLKERFSIWFFCENIDSISRLGRCVERNYSDGKWELLVDSTDVHPKGVFWLRSKEPFSSMDEMNRSVSSLIQSITYWFDGEFDNYFSNKESEDEGIRKEIVDFLRFTLIERGIKNGKETTHSTNINNNAICDCLW